MFWLRVFALRLRGLLAKPRLESELDQEIRSHLQMLTEENLRKGFGPDEARHAALRAFGGVEQMKEAYRERRGLPPVESLFQDLRYAARSLRRNPGFAAAAGLALALGIGANTAIFSFADLALTRPVALPELHRLAAIVGRKPPSQDDEQLSPANYLDLKAAATSFDAVAAYQYWSAGLTGQGEPAQIEGVRASANFFSTLGVKPALGRVFLAEEQEQGKERVIVLSDGFWQVRFGGDPSVLGRPVKLDGQTYAVIGMMPPSFRFPLGAHSFWVPMAMDAAEKSLRAESTLYAVGHVRPGVALEQARAEVETIWSRLEKQYPESNAGRRATAIELRRHIVRSDERQFLFFLLGVVGFVLLIACANVANLQLARAAGRNREIALRTALGASRWRILRQLLTESVVLAAAGAAMGLLLALWGIKLLGATMPAEISSLCDLHYLQVDARALAFTFCLAIVAGLVSGLAPAWQNSRAELNDTLKEGGRRTTGGGRSHHLRRVFVVAEVALALVLLVGAGLMVKGFVALATASPELEPNRLLTFTVTLPKSRYWELYQLRAFYQQALERIQRLPEVQSAAVVSGLPYSFYDNPAGVSVEGQAPAPAGQLPEAMLESISSGYFRTMHIPLREGRAFDLRDTAGSPPVAIISESMARRLWPGTDAVGKRLRLGTLASGSPWLTVVGVAGDTRHEVYDSSFRSILYRPYQQLPPRAMDFALRCAGDPIALFGAVRAEVSQLDKNRPLEQVETMAAKIRRQASALQYVAALMGIFAAIALGLAALGVYAVMAYAVNERRHEIGVRMALGARPRDVLRHVLAGGLVLTAYGLAIGIPVALALARALSGLIYGVNVWDPVTFIAVPLALAAIALAASYIPARRATKVDPIIELRYQ